MYDTACGAGLWNTTSIQLTAPTAHDDEGTPATNPDFNHLLRGTVHDPTTRRMGGVAGHAGVFSTAHDVSLFAQALLDKLLRNTGPFPLKQSTLQLMTAPEQPGHSPAELTSANEAEQAAIAAEPATGPGATPSSMASSSTKVGSHDAKPTPDPLLAPATPPSKTKTSAASAGTSTPPSPNPAAASSRSAASATPASPAPRSGSTPPPTPTSSC